MNFNFISYIASLSFLFSIILLKAQNQFPDLEKEKTYIQTNHVFYKPGEEMYFKIYIVKGDNNLPAEQSKVVNFQMTDPGGAIIKKSKYEIKNGHAEGYFYFADDMKGGVYKIKAYTNWMQNEEGKNAFEKEITLQKIASPRILMKLDFPKKGYGAGDEVLADFSMRSLANLPIPFYEADFTVMQNGEVISNGKLVTDKEGKNQLRFRLPEVLQSSDGLLNIKVNFDGFTESISRNIPIVLHNLDVKFMPEGGTLINGIEQNIAFKAMDEFEKPVDAVVAVFNQNNQKITESTAYHFGMGSFIFTPKNGETYYAKVVKPEKITQTYPFPTATNSGVVFNITKGNKILQFKINTTEEKKISIKGTFRDKEIYAQEVLLKKGINQFEIVENELPVGISRFTIFEGAVPLAERIVFANEYKQMNIKLSPGKKNYLPREKVIVAIETTDENHRPVSANLGVSVVDDKLWTYADDKQNHIISWLLMDSELKGKIEKPQFYFDKKEEKAEKSLDLVMLTNGYRYFELIPEVSKNKKYKYLPEKRNPIYGVVVDENKKPVKAEVFLTQEGYASKKIIKQITGENGQFYFTDLNKDLSYKIIARSLKPKHKVNIRIISYTLDINPLAQQKLLHIDMAEIMKEFDNKESRTVEKDRVNELKKPVTSKHDTISTRGIEEVITLGYAQTKTSSAIAVVRKKEIENNDMVSVLNGKVSGVSVVTSSGQTGNMASVRIRGTASLSNKTPLYIVDGVPVDNFNTSVNTNDIASITILKDAAATAIYGSSATNGVVIVNSLTNRNSTITLKITPKTYFAVKAIPYDSLKAYSYSREFSYPEYKTTNTSYRYDDRETVYWNPVVETDKNGKAKIEFYNSDANTAFRILSEGVSASGLLGRHETAYAAQSLISIDAKIPQYLTRTDQMMIPVVIKNNSAETRKMMLETIVPNDVRLIKSDSTITLKPLESGRLFVNIQTDELVDSNLQFIVRSGDFRETLILPFKVGEKGFPHQYSIINNKAEKIKIDIPDYINGSFFSSYYVYENAALQMFEDVERLKKEPYGCFEQLSSTVYPAIFILDYLKSVHKIDKETENIAAKNMKKGYQKMLSYKNRDGGFGYFNSSESDVAVSAFALLEFTNLKKYVQIDPKLIRELTTFIRSKKNKNGLFEVRKKHELNVPYSEYAWSRNMYVVYALSKLGFKNEIEDSYKLALNRALATKDTYQLALVANTAAYLGRNEEYNHTIGILNEEYKSKNIKPMSTFTGSGGRSASAEALSLYMMALQKDEKLNPLLIAEVADELITYNGYYGYGSTQATGLALEALSEFFSKNEKRYGNDKPKIKINGADISSQANNASAYQAGENEIKVDYQDEKGLPYKLEYQYYTLQVPKSSSIPLIMETKLQSEKSTVGEINRMTVTINNKINGSLPMTTAKIGIPAGLSLQNALLKDMVDKKQVSYYEIFDHYLVLYWEHFDANEKKVINLDLKVEFAGEYTGKSSNVYLYYMPEAQYWNQGINVKIEP